MKTKFNRYGKRHRKDFARSAFGRVWKAAVLELSRRFGMLCWYCGAKLCLETVSLDHMVPLSRGGADEIDNLALCCYWCQFSKQDNPLDQFLQWVRVREIERIAYLEG